MKINSFKKKNNNQYQVLGDKTLTLFADTILKFELLTKKEISETQLKEILEYDNSITIYNKIINRLKHKRLTEYEIEQEFKKNNINNYEELITKLKNTNLINDLSYTKDYIHDALYIKNHGPRKIEVDLLKKGINLSVIRDELNNISDSEYETIIDKLIEKKIKTNHTNAGRVLSLKIANQIVHQGFTKEMVSIEIKKYDFNNKELLQKTYEKEYRLLSKKYTGKELDYKIKQKLINKGFDISQL